VGQIIASSGIASNLISRKVSNIVNQDFTPAFALAHMQKDLGLIARSAESVGAAIPVSSLIHQLYTAAREQGHGEEDSAALFYLIAEMAGLKL